MSKAVYIHGIANPSVRAQTHFFAPIDYTVLTDGELSVLLAARQAELLYLSTGNEAMKADSNYLKSLVSYTVSGKDIAGTSRLKRWAENRIRQGNYPAMSASIIQAGRVGRLLSFTDYRSRELSECEKIRREWENTSTLAFTKRSKLRKSWESCFAAAEYLNTVNQSLEQSGAHLLFSFQGVGGTQAMQVKKVLHKIAVENFSTVFGLSRENIMLWIRNGVLAQNIKKGMGDMQPEETIKYLVDHVTEVYPEISGRVGALPAIIAAVKIALEIISLAVAAIGAILAALKPDDYIKAQANVQGLGTIAFGPEKDDFLTELSTAGVESGAIYALAAAAAILILK